MISLRSVAEVVSQRLYQLDPVSPSSANPSDIEMQSIAEPLAATHFDFSRVGDDSLSIASMVASGQVLGIVQHDRRVLARGLIQLSGMIALEGHRNFRPLARDEAFLHFFRTAEDARGQHLYPRLINFLLSQNVIQGKTVLISCREDNVASIKGIERAGGRLILRMKTIGFAGGRFAYTRQSKVQKGGNI